MLGPLSLTIPAGTALALVGVNGAGKSTLIKLLCRFYDPERGHITRNGVDLRQCSVEQLRSRIGAAFQDYQTYELTAAENIGVGDVKHIGDRARIEASAKTAGASTIVEELPHGYDTMISRIFSDSASGKGGVALSGGQGQRVALARSLMRADADLLILDEPSAGLDAIAESQVHATMRAHRLGVPVCSYRIGSTRCATRT